MLSGSTFGRRLRALRLAQDMSQVELARRIGRHQTAIGPYERDEYEPPRDVVEKLALVLETSPEYLYFGRNPSQIALPVVGQSGERACSRRHPRRPWSCCGCVISSCVVTGSLTTAWPPFSARDRSCWHSRPLTTLRLPSSGATRWWNLSMGAPCSGVCCQVRIPHGSTLRPTTRPFYRWSEVREGRSIVGVFWPEAFHDGDAGASRESISLKVDEKF